MATQFDLPRVRQMAQRANLQEIYHNTTSRVISFVPLHTLSQHAGAAWGLSGGRMNIYYTTRTVGTCLDHPLKGKTQLFRTSVSYELLQELMSNPRAHTGMGYQHRPKAAQLTPYEAASVPSDEESELVAQAKRIETQLAAFTAIYIAPYQSALQEVQKSLTSLKRKREQDELEERARQEAEAERRRVQEKRRREEEAAEAERRRIEERKLSKEATRKERGEHYVCNISDKDSQNSFLKKAGTADTFRTIETLTLTPDGFFFKRENGDSYWSGLPRKLADRLDQERKNTRGWVVYLACSPDGENYYCELKDGSSWWSDFDDDFSTHVETRQIQKVTLGPNNSYWVAHDAGSNWKGLPIKVSNILRSRNPRLPAVSDLSLGPDDTWFLRFDDGSYNSVLPNSVSEAVDTLGRHAHVTSVSMVEGGSFFIRHN